MVWFVHHFWQQVAKSERKEEMKANLCLVVRIGFCFLDNIDSWIRQSVKLYFKIFLLRKIENNIINNK